MSKFIEITAFAILALSSAAYAADEIPTRGKFYFEENGRIHEGDFADSGFAHEITRDQSGRLIYRSWTSDGDLVIHDDAVVDLSMQRDLLDRYQWQTAKEAAEKNARDVAHRGGIPTHGKFYIEGEDWIHEGDYADHGKAPGWNGEHGHSITRNAEGRVIYRSWNGDGYEIRAAIDLDKQKDLKELYLEQERKLGAIEAVSKQCSLARCQGVVENLLRSKRGFALFVGVPAVAALVGAAYEIPSQSVSDRTSEKDGAAGTSDGSDKAPFASAAASLQSAAPAALSH